MAGQWPSTAAASLRYLLGAAGFGLILLMKEGRGAFAAPRPRIQLLRGCGVAMATAGYFSALFVMPMATASAITFVSPMLTAMLAALFLGEPMRRETVLASVLAFAGVLVVLRPNFAVIGWAALLPLFAALGMSMLIMGNRLVAGLASPLAMQFFVAATAAPVLLVTALGFHLSGVAGFVIGWPDWTIILRCMIVALVASSAHWLLYLATTRAGAATIAPMTYVQLLFSAIYGWAFFGDHPDGMTMLGAAMIIAAGLYLWRANPAQSPKMA